MIPFDLLTPEPPDWRGREPERNAWVELYNIVVASSYVNELGPEHAIRIQRTRGVDLSTGYLRERVELYERFLTWTLAMMAFDESERQRLAAIARTLWLSPSDLHSVHERAHETAMDDAVADGFLDVEERLLLDTLEQTLGQSPE